MHFIDKKFTYINIFHAAARILPLPGFYSACCFCRCRVMPALRDPVYDAGADTE
jgi:hypothetical protein